MSDGPQKKSNLAPDVAQAMRLANDARKRRAKAPNTPVGEKNSIKQKNLMREAARIYKEKGLQVPHMLFIPKKEKLKEYGYDGYAPVLENIDSGDTFEIQGDIMVECPEKQYQESLKATSMRSERVLQSTVKKAIDEGGGDEETKITSAKGSPDGSIVGPEKDLLSGSENESAAIVACRRK